MTRILKFLALATVLALVTSPAHAQFNPFRIVVVTSNASTSVSTSITAVSTAPALLIKWVGDPASAATIAVTTDDFLFTTDGTTVDSTINVQATTPCGASLGTLDTGDTDCDTAVELINEINASANWVAVPIGVIASDNAAAYFLDVTEVDARAAAGIPVFNDSATTLQTTNAFTPSNTVDIRDFMNGKALKPNYWDGVTSTLQWYLQNFVGSAGAGSIFAVKGNFSPGKVYTETSRTIYAFTGSATGVDKELDFKAAPLFCNLGERLVFRGASGTTHTSPVQRAFGFLATK